MPVAETAPRQERILVVDDEPTILDTVAYNLRSQGFQVSTATDGPSALELIAMRPHVVVLDIMLPGMDGLEVLRRIRQCSTVPVILLSARGEEIDRVVGLEIGADDYLTKPFAMRELIARVRAMVRRSRMDHQHPDAEDEPTAVVVAESPLVESGTMIVGDIRLDTAGRQASRNGQALGLKPKEYDLLEYFARHAGVVLSRDALLREVWGYQHRIDTRTVDVHIRWLRQKLEDDPGVPQRLITVRGHGYRFVIQDADD